MSTRMDISLRARVEANFPLYTTSGKLTFSGALIRYFGDDRYAEMTGMLKEQYQKDGQTRQQENTS